MAGDDDRMESPSPDPQLGSTDALRAEIEQLRKDKANADAQQQSHLQQGACYHHELGPLQADHGPCFCVSGHEQDWASAPV